MHVDPAVTPFTVISFFFLFFFFLFSRVSGRSLIFRITHPQFCIPLRVTPSVQSGSREGEVKLEYRGRFDQTIFLIFSASIIIAQCCVYYGDHNGEKNYCGISWKKYMINYRFSKNLTIRRCFSRYIILERSTVRNLLLRQD